jgi:ClpP class serine protease
MTSFPLWAERLYNRPLALDEFKNEVLCEFAQSRLLGTKAEKITAVTLDRPAVSAMADEASFYRDGERLPYAVKGDIAVIPVRGTLVHRGSWLDSESGLVGYDRIIRQARAARNDPQVSATWIPFDSGGGECAGMFAAAEELASMAKAEGGKPIYAWLDERACSAAYVLASACDKIYGRQEIMGASIAAIINILDKSVAYQKAGLEPIAIRAEWADRKARGQAGEKIDKDTIARLGAIVDETSEQIVEFVSAMRGKTPKSIRDLRGEVLTGPDLLKFGLIDGIMSEDEAWAALKAEARAA